MNCETETLLLQEVAPRLRAAIQKTVPMVGPDDPDELVQDGLAIILALRSGRRSTGVHKNDVLHPSARLHGHARVQSLDEPVSAGEDGEEPLTFHDCLASNVDDPATTAARRLDWETVVDSLDRTAKSILVALIEGRELTLLVSRLKRSRSALQSDKARLGRLIRERLGHDILQQVQTKPGWTETMDALRERFACRTERRAA